MSRRKRIAIILGILALSVLAVIVYPADQSEGATEASLAELNATPVAQLTAADLGGLQPADLGRLDPDLRRAIQTPVSVTVESGATGRSARCGRGNPCRTHSYHVWRHRNAFGMTLYWYRLDISWTWNLRRVWDFDSSDQADGSWGWHFCHAQPRGEEWIGSRRTGRKAFGFGHFGLHPVTSGCVLGERIIGGSVTGYYNGVAMWQ